MEDQQVTLIGMSIQTSHESIYRVRGQVDVHIAFSMASERTYRCEHDHLHLNISIQQITRMYTSVLNIRMRYTSKLTGHSEQYIGFDLRIDLTNHSEGKLI